MKSRHLLGTSLASLALVAVGMSPAPAAPALNDPQQQAVAWLADQIPSGTHLFETAYTDFNTGDTVYYVDYGVNLDVQHTLRELGQSSTADQVYAAVVADGAKYTDAYGTRYAGAVGKLATYMQLKGDAPQIDDGGTSRDLLDDLNDLMVPDGAEKGRFKDAPDSEWQSANNIGQSWGVRALALAGDASTGDAAAFLLSQQCSDGGFRESPGASPCTSTADATAFAAVALDDVGGHASDVAKAVAWLKAKQKADGSVDDAGNPNTNSTGLAAQLFADHGESAAAKHAAAWIKKQQLTGGPDAGAIASTAADRAAQGSKKIAVLAQDKYVRATYQAALGLASWELGPVDKLSLKVSAGKPKQGDTITVTATGQDAYGQSLGDVSDDIEITSSVATDTVDGNRVTFNHASPHVLTVTHVPSGTTAAITVQVTPVSASGGSGGSSAGSNGSGASGGDSLPDTGSPARPWEPGLAALMVLLGVALVAVARERRFVAAHRSDS